MTAWIAIALWLVPLIGQVQALPVCATPPLIMEDLGFELLDEVLCGDNNFTSPTNVMYKCHGAALGLFIKELSKVHHLCEDKSGHVNQTIEVLENVNSTFAPCVPQKPAECTLTMEVHKNFADFINAMKVFAEKLYDASSGKKSDQG